MNDIKTPVRYDETASVLRDSDACLISCITITNPELGHFIAAAINEKVARERVITVQPDQVVKCHDGRRYVANKPHILPDGARILKGGPHEEGTEAEGYDYICGNIWCRCTQ